MSEKKPAKGRRHGLPFFNVGSKDKGSEEEADPPKKIYLDELLESIGNALVMSKRYIDQRSEDERKNWYFDEKSMIHQLPFSTFDISDADITLRFVTNDVEYDEDRGNRIVISTDFARLAASPDALSELKVKFNHRALSQHNIGDQVVLKDE